MSTVTKTMQPSQLTFRRPSVIAGTTSSGKPSPTSGNVPHTHLVTVGVANPYYVDILPRQQTPHLHHVSVVPGIGRGARHAHRSSQSLGGSYSTVSGSSISSGGTAHTSGAGISSSSNSSSSSADVSVDSSADSSRNDSPETPRAEPISEKTVMGNSPSSTVSFATSHDNNKNSNNISSSNNSNNSSNNSKSNAVPGRSVAQRRSSIGTGCIRAGTAHTISINTAGSFSTPSSRSSSLVGGMGRGRGRVVVKSVGNSVVGDASLPPNSTNGCNNAAPIPASSNVLERKDLYYGTTTIRSRGSSSNIALHDDLIKPVQRQQPPGQRQATQQPSPVQGMPACPLSLATQINNHCLIDLGQHSAKTGAMVMEEGQQVKFALPTSVLQDVQTGRLYVLIRDVTETNYASRDEVLGRIENILMKINKRLSEHASESNMTKSDDVTGCPSNNKTGPPVAYSRSQLLSLHAGPLSNLCPDTKKIDNSIVEGQPIAKVAEIVNTLRQER